MRTSTSTILVFFFAFALSVICASANAAAPHPQQPHLQQVQFPRTIPRSKATTSLNARTFSDIISAALLPATETILFNITLDADETSGMVTHWWMTGNNVPDAVVRFYVDGETTPSIDVNLDMNVGIGFNDDSVAPWGNNYMGKQAHMGGVYNNIRIPFSKSLQVAVMQGPAGPSYFYFIVRGVTAVGDTSLPISVGGFQLPEKARLKLYAIRNVTYAPLDKVYIVNITGSAGALFMTSMAVQSGTQNFLEGCVRCFIDDGAQMLLSSGTEDYFASAYYFDAGLYQNSVAGLTRFKEIANSTYPWTISMYRIHDTDPILFANSFQLVWRNGDTMDPTSWQKCVNDNGIPVGTPTASLVTTYAWVYQW